MDNLSPVDIVFTVNTIVYMVALRFKPSTKVTIWDYMKFSWLDRYGKKLNRGP